MEVLAIIIHAIDKFNNIIEVESKFRIIATVTIILKHVQEACCDAVFNNIQIDISRLLNLVENDLKLELGKLTPLDTMDSGLEAHYWSPPPKG